MVFIVNNKIFLRFGVGVFSKYFPAYANDMKRRIIKSNLEFIAEVYLGKILFFTALAFIVSLALMIPLTLMLGMDLIPSILLIVLAPIIAGLAVFWIGFYYPTNMLNRASGDIEANMPFAINHMAAVVSSGAKPSAMFEFLSKNKEYGEISKEAGYIFRNIKVLGMDMTTAIKEVADRTPNKKFSEFLYGLVSEIKGGGEMKSYLSKAAEDSLFDYRIRREKYLSLLSNYADIYIAVLIVAPLFFIAILSIMSMIGGQIAGFGIRSLIELGVYALLPLLNVVFLVFVHTTQPRA